MAASGNLDKTGSMFRLLTTVPRPRELTGSMYLLSHYGLRDQYESFCQRPLPVSIAESHYLLNVVGDMEIRRGEGMELMQLLQGPDAEASNVHIQPFDLDMLQHAFILREPGPISLPEADQGMPTISGKVKVEQKDKDKKHRKRKKHKDKDRHKDRDKDVHKDKEKVKQKDYTKRVENGDDHSKKHHRKKRKHDAEEEDGEAHKHKRKKHKHSSKSEVAELRKNGR